MDKLSGALRRSGSILKSMKSGHEDLHKIISDIDHMKYTCESFTNAQNSAWENMSKWASKETNIALMETFQHLFQINCIWSEVQREFIGSIKKFKMAFKKILESELELDRSYSKLKQLQQQEICLIKKCNSDSGSTVNEKIQVLKNKIECAQVDVNYKTIENEHIKLMSAKKGLDDMSQSYVQWSDKNAIVSNAQYDISRYLPDIDVQEIQNARFTGSEEIKIIVQVAKQNVMFYRPQLNRENSPPPPYAVVTSQIARYSGNQRSDPPPAFTAADVDVINSHHSTNG